MIGEYFFAHRNCSMSHRFIFFSSLKLSLHRFYSPPHCFYSLYHRSSFSSVARSGCSLIHWINSFLTKITHSDLCEASSYAFWCTNSGQFPKRPFSVFHRLIKLQGKSGDSRDQLMIVCDGATKGGERGEISPRT